MPLFVLVPLIALATQRAFDAEQQIFIDQHQITTVTCVTMVLFSHVSTLALLYAWPCSIGLALLYATRGKRRVRC